MPYSHNIVGFPIEHIFRVPDEDREELVSYLLEHRTRWQPARSVYARLGYYVSHGDQADTQPSWNASHELVFQYSCMPGIHLDRAPHILPDLLTDAFRVIEHWRRTSHPGSTTWCFQPAVRIISRPVYMPGVRGPCTILLVCTLVELEWSPLWPGPGEGPRGNLGDPCMTRRILYVTFLRRHPGYQQHIDQVRFGIQSTGRPQLDYLFSLSHITTVLPEPVGDSADVTGYPLRVLPYPRHLSVQFPYIRWNPDDLI